MLNDSDLAAIWTTIQLATVTTLILLLISTPLAWWLAWTRWRFKFLVEAVVTLPLVLPPTVLGFYLMIALGPSWLGRLSSGFGGWAFTFTGLVIGSVFYSLPFVVQPLQDTFVHIGQRPLEIAATLRAAPLDRFLTIVLPLARSGYLTATVLGFSHTIGEFGVVLMIGGNIPYQTRVLSIAIYESVEGLAYTKAHLLSIGLLLTSLILLTLVYLFNRKFKVIKIV